MLLSCYDAGKTSLIWTDIAQVVTEEAYLKCITQIYISQCKYNKISFKPIYHYNTHHLFLPNSKRFPKTNFIIDLDLQK